MLFGSGTTNRPRLFAVLSCLIASFTSSKSFSDAEKNNARLKELAEKYLESQSEKKQINITFIGAGATGIEVAAGRGVVHVEAEMAEPENLERTLQKNAADIEPGLGSERGIIHVSLLALISR